MIGTEKLGCESVAMQIKNVEAELTASPVGEFLNIAEFNGRSIGACAISGASPVWEMHPDTDELFYLLEGEFEITLLQKEGPEHFVVPAGSLFVVPKGIWHRPAAPNGAKFMYYTPGRSLHSEAEDPREVDV